MTNYSKSFSDLGLVAATHGDLKYSAKRSNIQFELSYPIVVLQGPLYQVQDDHGKAILTEVAHLQLHHFVSGPQGITPVQIDVVTEQAFPSLIETILNELDTCRNRIQQLYQRLMASALEERTAIARHRNLTAQPAKDPIEDRREQQVQEKLGRLTPAQVGFIRWLLDHDEIEEQQAINISGLHPHAVREGIIEGEKLGLVRVRKGPPNLIAEERFCSINPNFRDGLFVLLHPS